MGNIKTITDTVRGETTNFNYDDLDRLLSASIAGVYSQGWGYNAIGNIITSTLGGNTSNYAYNPSNPTQRPHAVTQAGNQTYAYDGNGNMSYRTENGGTYFQTWDAENRVSAVISPTASTHMVYNANGQRVYKTEYTNQATSFSDTFDSANTSAWTFSAYQTVPYNDGGQNVVKSAGTGTSYDANFYRNTSLTSGKSVSVDFKVDGDCSYLHLAIESNDGGAYNRLAALAACGGLYAQYYNEAHPVWGDYVPLIVPLKLNTWYRVTWRIDDSNKFKIEAYERDGDTASGGFVYPMRAGKNWNFHSWIYRNNGYVDNYVERTDSVRATSYVGNYYEVTNGTITKYYYFVAQRVAMQTSAGVTYLHGDNLGSTSATSGAQPSSQTYYAYGAVRTTSGTLPTDFTYTGQRVDSYIKLLQMGARWYDHYLNRFIQPDSIVSNLYNPQSLNRYAYALNNPLRYTDPSGHDPLDWLINFVVGAGRQVIHINALTVGVNTMAPQENEPIEMTAGRHVGNFLVMAQSILEMEGAIALFTGGTAGGAVTCLETLGGGCIAGVAVDTAAATVGAHSVTVATGAAVEEGGMLSDALDKMTGKGNPKGGGKWEKLKNYYNDEIEARRLSDKEVHDLGFHDEKNRYIPADADIYVDKDGNYYSSTEGGPLEPF